MVLALTGRGGLALSTVAGKCRLRWNDIEIERFGREEDPDALKLEIGPEKQRP
jgi:hypothetical protein